MATNNERNNEPTSNTFGLVYRNFETQTAVAVSFFSTRAKIAIHLPKDEKNGIRNPDFKSGVAAYLSASDCKKIVKRARKALRKYDETGEFDGFAIPLNRGLLELAQVSDLQRKMASSVRDANPESIALVIYTDVDDSKKSDKYMIHPFSDDMVIKNYDASTGSYEREAIGVDFEYFLDSLEEFALGMTNGRIHAAKEESMYDRTRWEKLAFELATNLGIDLRKPSPSKPSKPSVNWNDNSTGGSDRHAGNRNASAYEVNVVEVDQDDVDAAIARMTQGE